MNLKSSAILLAIGLLSVGCGTQVNAPPVDSSYSKAKPLEIKTGTPPIDMPVGTFSISGDDDAGTTWLGTLVVQKDGEGRLRGQVDWLGRSTDGNNVLFMSGRELLDVSFDEKMRTLELKGTSVIYANGILPGYYRCTFSKDGLSLLNGSWQSLDGSTVGAPGKWSGKRLGF